MQNNQTAVQKCQFENNDKANRYTTVYSWCNIKGMCTIDERRSLKLLGKRIRFFRNQRGWTQSALAKKAGTSVSYVGNIENALRPSVSWMIIRKIALALGVSPNCISI